MCESQKTVMNITRILVCISSLSVAVLYLLFMSDQSQAASKEIHKSSVQKTLACAEPDTIRFINGSIITMDRNNAVVSALEIEGDRISALGSDVEKNRNKGSANCLKTIDLNGRTVVPGLIDSHVHFLRAGNWPGHRVYGAEKAHSISALQTLIKNRVASLPDGDPITVIGGITPIQFKESRLPSLQELDAVAPNHVVYLQVSFFGPAMTNSAGREFFAQKGLNVADNGSIAQGPATGAAIKALKSNQTHEERKGNLLELMRYANSLGLTTVFDEAGTRFHGASFFDNRRDYAAVLDLWRGGKTSLRIRSQRLTYDKSEESGELEAYMDSAWPQFGDDMFKVVALGEHVVSFPSRGKVSPAYRSKALAMASAGWSHEQHSTSHRENLQHIDAIESAHKAHPISRLRWSLAHAMDLGRDGDLSQIKRLKAMGMGVRLQNQGYHYSVAGHTQDSESSRSAGPFYRTLLDSEIPLGIGSDGALVGSINPWHSIFYMLSGKNMEGQLVNAGQTLTRLEALRMHTINNTWFSYEEADLGSLEIGKKADLVVLNEDYLMVPEERIRSLKSVLTLVDGKVVYDDTEASLLN